MSFTLSPSMSLPIPGVGTEAGPQYAFDINNALTIIDSHNHTAGSGVQITPAAININAALPFSNNAATNLAYLGLIPQTTLPTTSALYEFGTDLYFADGAGNPVRITANGGIAGTPGSIAGLAAPATVTYVSGSQTFVFQSDTAVAANIDAGAYLFRNLSPNSTNALTLQAPSNLSSNYTLTLPTIPPVLSFLTIDAAGSMAPGLATVGALTTANLSASAGILGSQLSATAAIVGSQLSASAGILGSQLVTNPAIAGTIPTSHAVPLVVAPSTSGSYGTSIVYGIVTGGVASGGAGYTVINGGATVAFNVQFRDFPAITMTPTGANLHVGGCYLGVNGVNGFSPRWADDASAILDYHFIAIGQRGD